MLTVLKYVKLFGKLTAVLIVVFVILTYQHSHIIRSRIQHFKAWRASFEDVSNIKHILIWSHNNHNYDVLLNDPFVRNKCFYSNCNVTKMTNTTEGYANYDAILFSENLISGDVRIEMPEVRFWNQTYVFVAREAANYYPACEEKYDNYFNLTWTYKLDSDLVWPYFTISTKQGQEIAPRTDTQWEPHSKPVQKKIGLSILKAKKYPAVWFVSNCYTESRRETYVNELKVEFKEYGLEIHVIGSCGTRVCSIGKDKKCMKSLKQYYFYLAFENSISEDYVSEKVMKALLYYTVPVVYGGANYSRFLPPHSYINARKLGPKKTAAAMASLISNQTEYLKYFSWQNYYFVKNKSDSVCKLCEAINKQVSSDNSDFRRWWNPDYKVICKKRRKFSKKKTRRLPWFGT